MNDKKKMDIRWMPIGDIIPYDDNPRLNEDAVDAVAESIANYGFRNPIIVDGDNVIICGHTRRLAALKLGLEKVPVLVADDLTPEQVKAFRLDDNKTAEMSQWDFGKLQSELLGLEDAGYDMDTLAFGKDELQRILDESAADDEEGDESESASVGDADEGVEEQGEQAEAEDAVYDSEEGGIYQLGEHRLVCGDCREGLDMARLLGGDGGTPVSLWLTDPPYNVDYAGRSNKTGEDIKRKGVRNQDMKIGNDDMEEDEFREFLMRSFGNCAAYMRPGASFYVFHAHTVSHLFLESLRSNGMEVASPLVWVKNHFAMNFATYMFQHEPIWFGWKKGAAHSWYGAHDATTTTVQKWNIVQKCDMHPTMKPVDMLEYFIKNSSARGDMVLDTFGGSGSTLIACENTGRKCRMMELMPRYCDVIRKRWAEAVHGAGCDWKALAPKIGEIVK